MKASTQKCPHEPIPRGGAGLRKGSRLSSLVIYILMAMLVLALVGCGKQESSEGSEKSGSSNEAGESASEEISGFITAVGSTAMEPLVKAAADQFTSKNPKAQVVVQGGGSGTGLSQVFQGGADIGNSDVFAEEKEGIDASQLVDHKICVVGVACVVNPGVTVDSLTKQQLIDIFTAKITNWKEVGGPDQEIVVIHRPKGSGTRATFKKFALDGTEESDKGMEQESSGAVKKIVAETPGAISYLALSYVDETVKAMAIDGVAPTVEGITDGKYPVWAYQHMYTKGEPTGLTKAFLEYMLSPEVQDTLVTQMGYIPITQMKVERDAQGNVKPL
ncbi:MAG TPA: phosphate ABC transporter substrate-binding protein [Clostridia bacterium]|nr:phosphate ABC transporter substrate-binding protein [Clostridia bacterium]